MDGSTLTLYIGSAVLVILGIIGLALFLSGIVRLFRGRFFNGPSRSLGGLVLLLAVVFIVMLVLDLDTYFALTYERPVAVIQFNRLGPQYFHARLNYGRNRVIETDLHGDAWQLDARIIKWHGFATVLGLKTLYRFDRLSGRYNDVAQERSGLHSAVSLQPDTWMDSWSLAHRYGQWLPWTDASYGSATYLPMADGAQYQVTLSNTGLLARPANAVAKAAATHW